MPYKKTSFYIKSYTFVFLEVISNENGIFRSSHWSCSVRKDVLKNFAISLAISRSSKETIALESL